MKYAINLGAYADPRTLGEIAHLAEEAGWDGVFLEDYVVYQNRQDIPAFDPWIALAAMAMRTENIRLGTEVTPLARRRPWKLARETVSLDHLFDVLGHKQRGGYAPVPFFAWRPRKCASQLPHRGRRRAWTAT